jgi:glycosyltransferase involved in cell wall biosynthesis
MNFLIITHVPHKPKVNLFYGYAPYIREMNMWLSYVEEVKIIAPFSGEAINPIDTAYKHSNIKFEKVSAFALTTVWNCFKTLFVLPLVFIKTLLVIYQADHIHLRCPGNMGLLGAIAQIFFPKKKKTAKYAGNWDPKAQQPLSYKLQRMILSNTFLTKNMQVLVYGNWENQTKNIKPFFTATYSENEIIKIENKSLNSKINIIFAGTLSVGKNPLYAIQLVEKLLNNHVEVHLEMYGEGIMRNDLESYILTNNLQGTIKLMGNQDKEILKKAYQKSNFLILPSKSEGWPKAVAEAMFWGCVPISTSVSCVPNMLDYGKRGILLKNNIEKDYLEVLNVIKNQEIYHQMSNSAQDWSQKYTLEYFEEEIKKLIIK